MIKHIVMWTLKDYADGRSKIENLQRFKQALENMAGVIPEIKSLEVGLNFDTSQDAFDIVLTVGLDNAGDLEAYQSHPEHIPVKELAGRIRAKRAVVDYVA